ncbi:MULTISPECIES: SMEK domain-containing protein [Enterobacteriaceae]|uniref:SMEK domain-containing protein n=2 Tax=Enterobacterales TaxID=91347 RepID=UPI001C640DFA|nr:MULTISPECIES: SMEK domain-containing protein [Enterobacteriaceae]MBW7732831.1 SMEK domain-containing protein [Enterobacter hormaechei]MDC3552141.1 SMEK domain-containing protein [Escherichia coli]HCU0623788.1 SMEK domain-containing protein [Enterobacter hormaechei]
MLDRQRKNNDITFIFSLLSTVITFNSKQGMFDINKTMEIVLTDLLNKVYDLSLINLNLIKHNHPAIDLGDTLNGIAVQVTSDGSKSKFDKTMDMLVKHGLDVIYNNIWIIIISNDRCESYTRKGFSTHIRNLSDVANAICEKPEYEFDSIYSFCEKNFSAYFPVKNANILELTQVVGSDLGLTINKFIEANKIDFINDDTNFTEDDIRKDLITLKSKLSKLNEMQRTFIFRVMEYTLVNNGDNYIESCIMPVSAVMSGRHFYEKKEIKEVADYLEQIRLAYYDEDNFRLNCATYMVSFTKGIYYDFDYMAAIVEYLRFTGTEDNLKKIIYDCDFSLIN